MTDRSLAVQQAVFSVLAAALAPVPVYDHAPQDAKFPFVDLASHQVLPNVSGLRPLNLAPVASHTLILAVWSAYRGQKEVLDILGKIRAALDHVTLTLSSGASILCHVASAESRLDADGVSYQGAVTLRIIAV